MLKGTKTFGHRKEGGGRNFGWGRYGGTLRYMQKNHRYVH